LTETVNAQTSIFLVSATLYTLLREKYNITADLVAGHSLGEYSAVFAAGGINFPDGLYLLKKRGTFMEESTTKHQGSMLAVLNSDEEKLKDIVKKHDKPGDVEHVAEIVNINAPNQLVVSGTLQELASVADDVKAAGGRALMLKVAGAFHSRLMSDAQKQFAVYMEKVDFHDLSVPLINNIEAKKITKASDVHASLVAQLDSPVLWWQSMQHFKKCDVIVEMGPGTKLSSMLARQWPDKKIVALNEQKDIDDLVALTS